jgi:hypothetical protein
MHHAFISGPLPQRCMANTNVMQGSWLQAAVSTQSLVAVAEDLLYCLMQYRGKFATKGLMRPDKRMPACKLPNLRRERIETPAHTFKVPKPSNDWVHDNTCCNGCCWLRYAALKNSCRRLCHSGKQR